ncbi:MAG: transposase [Treponema sp.]|nr:transposase [Treponema sp.]
MGKDFITPPGGRRDSIERSHNRQHDDDNNTAVLPGRRNRKEEIVYAPEVYKKRGLIERICGKLKENRRLAVRYEKSDINFLGFIFIAFLKILLF